MNIEHSMTTRKTIKNVPWITTNNLQYDNSLYKSSTLGRKRELI